MTCSARIVELVECARRGLPPGRPLRTHLAECPDCEARWQAERELSACFQNIRVRTAGLRSPEARRDSLEEQLRIARLGSRRRRVVFWAWGLSAAAAMLFAGFLGREVGGRIISTPVTKSLSPSPRSPEMASEASTDASALSSEDFISVPFTPPLAPGETVRVIHADLYPEALARMGIDVDPAWSSNLPADVVVGEDGFPRAVRIIEKSSFEE